MRKLILLLVLTIAISSCKTDKKEVQPEVKKEMITQIYQCPMDCEKGKSYTKEGNCPVCKMELKTKKTEEVIKKEDHSDHGHSH